MSRSFKKILASSYFFGSSTPAFSTSAPATTSTFFSQGSVGGPTALRYSKGLSLQGNFGGNGNPSSGTYGGTFNLLASNALEGPTFCVAASALVSGTGSVIFNVPAPDFSFIDFQFVPLITQPSSGFVSVILKVHGDES